MAVVFPARKTLPVPSSVMVMVPLTAAVLATGPVIVPVVRERFSDPSNVVSGLILTRSSTLVLPAAIVTPLAAEVQVEPLRYSTAFSISVPAVAVLLTRLGVKLTAPAAAALNDTATTAYSDASFTLTEPTDTLGASLAAIVAVPLVPVLLTTPPVIAPVDRVNVSAFSAPASSVTAILRRSEV